MFCDQCGNQTEKNSKFCDNCGFLFDEKAVQNPAEQRIQTAPKDFTEKIRIIGFSKLLNLRILIFAGMVGIIIIVGSVAFSFYQNYQTRVKTSSQELSKLQDQLQKVQESTGESLAKLREENKELKSESEELKTTIRSASSNPQKQELSSTNELSQELLDKIMLRIAKVKCLTGSGINEGSGVIQTFSGNNTPWGVYTNLHVIGLGNNAGICSVSLPQIPDYVPTTSYRAVTERVAGQYPDIDFAVLKVSGATEFFNEFPIPTCGVADIKIGDKVTVLGYPSFGGKSLTVTDGIISGIEYTSYGPIYKTSAKIDEGNSGGLAIDNNSGCGVGMPTWAVSGKFEGLGYIQSWDMIKKSGNL